MKDFYERNPIVWVRVSRRADKSFVFAIGYTGQLSAFTVTSYPREYLPTIKDARELAKTKAADYA